MRDPYPFPRPAWLDAMTAPRRAYAAALDLSRPIQPAERIPSHGTQLSADGTADLHPYDVCWDCATAGQPTGREPIARPILRPVALNLWDTSADSIPETWSLDR